MLQNRSYDNAGEIARVMENGFLTQFFGSNPKVHQFANELISKGRRDILRELNKGLKVLGTGSAELVVSELREQYNIPSPEELEKRKRDESRRKEAEKKRREEAEKKRELEQLAREKKERKKLASIRREQLLARLKKFSPVIILSVFCLLAFSAYKLFEEKIEFYHLNFKANGGDYIAQNNLGVIYEIGEGVPQDYKDAVKWYRKAAEQGHATAQLSLGLMYHYGQGVPTGLQRGV